MAWFNKKETPLLFSSPHLERELRERAPLEKIARDIALQQQIEITSVISDQHKNARPDPFHSAGRAFDFVFPKVANWYRQNSDLNPRYHTNIVAISELVRIYRHIQADISIWLEDDHCHVDDMHERGVYLFFPRTDKYHQDVPYPGLESDDGVAIIIHGPGLSDSVYNSQEWFGLDTVECANPNSFLK